MFINKIHFSIIVLSLMFTIPLLSQWSADFTDGELLEWSGDVDAFEVNDVGQLQLNAEGAGSSYIYRSSMIDADTVSIGVYHLMDFSPSDNNQSTIYLALDHEDVTIARGYYLQIGENGGDDAVQFFYLDNGVPELLGSGTMGAMATEPAVVRLQVDVYPSGLWSIGANYDGGNFTTLDLEIFDDRFSMSDSQYFGLRCKYSASRADLFYYDDVFVKRYEEDRTAPAVLSVVAISDNELEVRYSEPVTDAVVSDKYIVDNGIGSPVEVVSLGALGTIYGLTFDAEFDPGTDYMLTISDISDANDNVLSIETFLFNFPVAPQLGDLQLSEVLSDPIGDGEDFIELYNASDKYIDLNGLHLSNKDNEQSETISEMVIMAPKSYLALSEDTDFLWQEYKPDPKANLYRTPLPALNNDDGNISIIYENVTIDSFDYREDMHFQLIDDTEGVSLERVNFDLPTNNEGNWQSAAKSVRFATPGYANSNSLLITDGGDVFSLHKEVFSPNQDGEDDLMILTYALDKPGYVANISVHDAAGYLILDIAANTLLGTEGFVTWDGVDAEGNISDIGMYIIIGEVFHPDGEVISFREVAVLADFID